MSVGDAEADVYDLFLAPRPAGVDLLVRAAQDRRVEHLEHALWAAVRAAPVTTMREVTVPRRDEQPARTATLTVQWRAVTLRPPKRCTAEQLPSVQVWAVLASGAHPTARGGGRGMAAADDGAGQVHGGRIGALGLVRLPLGH